MGWLLLLGVTLTGLYIGRLFTIVYVAPGPSTRTRSTTTRAPNA